LFKGGHGKQSSGQSTLDAFMVAAWLEKGRASRKDGGWGIYNRPFACCTNNSRLDEMRRSRATAAK
jgi:hypothetical protein